MAIDYKKLLNRDFGTLEHSYTERDTMLYALGVGMGQNPLDEESLRFVYEEDLKVLPSQAVVLAYPGFWAKEPDTGIDWVRLLHAGQDLIVHKPLPAAACVQATTQVREVIDKGPDVGALIVSERTVSDKKTGEDYATVINTSLCRGDGGFAAPAQESPTGSSKYLMKPDPIPQRPPNYVCELPTLPQQALIYRLSGDFNPLHASPSVARRAGFRAPILHGLCTFGVLTHALIKTCCRYHPEFIRRLRVRFSAPVYPGDTIATEIWNVGTNELAFRCRSVQQDKLVINNGYALVL